MNLMSIVDLVFWLLLGVFFIWGAKFQYHELLIGICALLIGINKLVAMLRSNG